MTWCCAKPAITAVTTTAEQPGVAAGRAVTAGTLPIDGIAGGATRATVADQPRLAANTAGPGAAPGCVGEAAITAGPTGPEEYAGVPTGSTDTSGDVACAAGATRAAIAE